MELSVIIPIYNVQDFITKTLSSLLRQANHHFEIIIVDDGSKDEGCHIAESMLAEACFPEYQIIKQKNRGVSSARNVGIKAAKGTYVFFLDGDDYVAADFVERIYATIENQSPDVACWAFDKVDAVGQVTNAYFTDWSRELDQMSGVGALEEILLHRKLFICIGSAIYRKALLIENGICYTEGCINGEDQEFTYKALSKSDKVVYIDYVLSYYLQRDSSISFSYNPKRMDVVGALERTATYLSGNDTVPKTIIIALMQHNLLKEYVTNFFSCIDALKNNCSYSTKQSYMVVMADIQEHYPGLHRRMMNVFKKSSGLRLPEKVKYCLFFFFPIQYLNLITRKYEKKEAVRSLQSSYSQEEKNDRFD